MGLRPGRLKRLMHLAPLGAKLMVSLAISYPIYTIMDMLRFLLFQVRAQGAIHWLFIYADVEECSPVSG